MYPWMMPDKLGTTSWVIHSLASLLSIKLKLLRCFPSTNSPRINFFQSTLASLFHLPSLRSRTQLIFSVARIWTHLNIGLRRSRTKINTLDSIIKITKLYQWPLALRIRLWAWMYADALIKINQLVINARFARKLLHRSLHLSTT